MVTGSIASSYHGEPRATRDIDIVVDPTPDALNRLVDGLRTANFDVDPGAARQAAAGILAVTPDLDGRYIERWAEALGVEDGLRRIRETPGN